MMDNASNKLHDCVECGRVSEFGARGQGFETYLRCVVSLSKTLYSLKVLLVPRKWWLHPNMTEKLLTGMLSLNTNKHDCDDNQFEMLVKPRSDHTSLKYLLMCNFYSLIMVFPRYLLFHLTVGKLFSLQNLGLRLSLNALQKI